MVSRASPARLAALEVLTAIEERRGEPAGLLHASRYAALSTPDRNLMTELVYGVLRWRNRLDFVLAASSSRPLHKIDLTPLTALRIGLYQLRFSSRVPDRAAVDESVRLVHAFGASWSASFVNAVLRNAARKPDLPELPTKDADPIAYLTTTLSHPDWLVRRYVERLGVDGAEARCRVQNEPPPVHVRVAPPNSVEAAIAALADDGVSAKPVALAPRALEITNGDVRASHFYRDGKLTIQDAGAQAVASRLDVSSGDLVLDVCAAPGGKATALAEADANARVVAIDRRHRRTKLVRDLAARLARDNVFAVTADGRRLPVREIFDRVLVDAPCSSLGTLRRNPDIKWRFEEDALASHAALQLELLGAAAEVVAPGGQLVYATCSSEPEENEDVVGSFIAARTDFGLSGDYFVTTPERDGTDAHFAACLHRKRVSGRSQAGS